MRPSLKLAFAAVVFLAVAGCAPQPIGDENKLPATSSPVTMASAIIDAQKWTSEKPGRRYSVPSATSSMAPRITSKCVVLLEPYTGTPLYRGDVVRFNRGDTDNVLHEVMDATPTHVFISGINNSRSDGWFPRTTISMQMAGILYTAR